MILRTLKQSNAEAICRVQRKYRIKWSNITREFDDLGREEVGRMLIYGD